MPHHDPACSVYQARIVVVDDDPANRRLLAQVLRRNGFDMVDLLTDASGLHDLCEAEHIDLVLLDLDLPGLSGVEAIAQMHALLGERAPEVIVVSGDTRRETQVRALQCGACDYLTKPIDVGQLVARVSRHLSSHCTRVALHDQKRELETMVRDRTVQLRASRLQIVQLLGRAAEYRDNETGAHIMRMSHGSAALARRLGWSEDRCELLLNASPLHDIGKIAVPDAILLKNGPLDAREWAVMKQHTVRGAALLADTDNEAVDLARGIALCHHERWDGTGYPNALVGNAIPQEARIVAVADVFDALRSRRPYKEPWPLDRAVNHILSEAGRHFDPEVVSAFKDVVGVFDSLWRRFADHPPVEETGDGSGAPDATRRTRVSSHD